MLDTIDTKLLHPSNVLTGQVASTHWQGWKLLPCSTCLGLPCCAINGLVIMPDDNEDGRYDMGTVCM